MTKTIHGVKFNYILFQKQNANKIIRRLIILHIFHFYLLRKIVIYYVGRKLHQSWTILLVKLTEGSSVITPKGFNTQIVPI